MSCPYCGKQFDRHDVADNSGVQPYDGAITICWGCRELGVYHDTPYGLRIRQITDAELQDVMRDTAIERILTIMGVSTSPFEAIHRARNMK